MSLRKNIGMSKILFLTFLLFSVTSCTVREPYYCQISNRIAGSYVMEFARPRELMLTGYGGAMMDDIKNIELCFLSFAALNVDEARVLYVEMMEELLYRINCNEEVRPYLHNFPFEEENLKLRIGFEDCNGRITKDGHVALMSIAKDHILYFAAYDPVTEKFYTLYEAPYEEARKIVQEQCISGMPTKEFLPVQLNTRNFPKDGYTKEVARRGYDFQKKYFDE
ncbi:MAG: hypothetical protein S4CHLAM123_06100 [Chlamydiales bacterium]|nr:hypothetical protein [Chlamydiales bacterium]